MVSAWRRRPFLAASILAAGWVAAACSSARGGSESGAVGSSGATPSAVAIEKTSSYLTIENRAGLPLVDISVAVQTTNGMSFRTMIGRLETSAKREISYADLRSTDGTTFSPQWQRPARIAVTATDVVGKKYDLTVPWK